MGRLKKGLSVPKASGTNKTYYYKEILTVYNEAVRIALAQGKITGSSEDRVIDVIWGQNGEGCSVQTLKNMKLGHMPPNSDFLYFIKDYAGDKYDYTFLASILKKQSTISEIRLNDDGSIISPDGREFSSPDINDEMMCLLFLNFVALKNDGEIAEDVLFYDYLQTEPQKRREQDQLFFDYDPILKTVVLWNLNMVHALPQSAWCLVQAVLNDRDISTAIWNMIDQLIPGLTEQAARSGNAQYFISTRDRVTYQSSPSYDEIALTEYQKEFILKIPHLTADEWNSIIKLVTLHDLNPELYTEVANLMLQAFKVRQQSFHF